MILVTGATGTVGRELVDQLLKAGVKFRVLARDPAKAAFLGGKAEIVQGDLSKPDSLAPAMRGVDHVFLLTVDQDAESDRNVIRAAQGSGVGHVVKISTNFVVNDPPMALGLWHAEKEKVLMASGLGWTILRPAGFMSNSLQWVGSVKSQGVVYSSSGDVRSAPVDPYDIAAVALLALTQPGHEGKAYELTGPAALSQVEQVEILSRALGKTLACVAVPVSAAVDGMRRNPHMPPKLVDAMAEMLETIRAGKLSRGVTDTVERLTGRKARSFEDWCRIHRGAYF